VTSAWQPFPQRCSCSSIPLSLGYCVKSQKPHIILLNAVRLIFLSLAPNIVITKTTSGSAMAEGPRDALSVEILQLQNIPFEN